MQTSVSPLAAVLLAMLPLDEFDVLPSSAPLPFGKLSLDGIDESLAIISGAAIPPDGVHVDYYINYDDVPPSSLALGSGCSQGVTGGINVGGVDRRPDVGGASKRNLNAGGRRKESFSSRLARAILNRRRMSNDPPLLSKIL
jgi:hypothetical protein